MVDIPTSTVTGALRVGVQVVSARKRPVVEIYQQVHNSYSPEHEYPEMDSQGRRTDRVYKYRNQDIFVGLSVINIGSERAENVTFTVSGPFRRDHRDTKDSPIEFTPMDQMAPGQSMFLMRIRSHDLQEYEYSKTEHGETGMPIGTKTDTMTITVDYDGPNTFVNKVLRLWRHWRGLKQYQTVFQFNPRAIPADLPPPQYA